MNKTQESQLTFEIATFVPILFLVGIEKFTTSVFQEFIIFLLGIITILRIYILLEQVSDTVGNYNSNDTLRFFVIFFITFFFSTQSGIEYYQLLIIYIIICGTTISTIEAKGKIGIYIHNKLNRFAINSTAFNITNNIGNFMQKIAYNRWVEDDSPDRRSNFGRNWKKIVISMVLLGFYFTIFYILKNGLGESYTQIQGFINGLFCTTK